MTVPAEVGDAPPIHPLRLIVSWLVSAVALLAAAYVIPPVTVNGFGGALVAALLISILNALLPPVIAAIRLPFALIAGFLLVLAVDAGMLLIVSAVRPEAI